MEVAKPDTSPKAVIDASIDMGASDILFEPQSGRARIRVRTDGVLEEYGEVSKEDHSRFLDYLEKNASMKTRTDMNHEPMGIREGYFETDYNGRKVMLRATVLSAIRGDMAAVRVLDPANLTSLEELGFGGYHLNSYKEIVGENGIVLVTGPTGAGKTTTVYATLKHLDPRKKNIFTLEDPVEYPIDGINQISVDRLVADQSFPAYFSGILRATPDVIYAGEIRDFEVAQTAFRAADIGHTILATAHSNDSERVMRHMMGMGIEHDKIYALNGVVSQRLVRELCGGCKMEYSPDDVMNEKERQILKSFGIERAYRENPEGCGDCDYRGFDGRTGVFEVLDTRSDRIKEQMILGGSSKDIRDIAMQEGQKIGNNLGQTALGLVHDGKTSIHEGYRMFPGYNLVRKSPGYGK